MIRRFIILAFLGGASAAGTCDDGWHKDNYPHKDCDWVAKNTKKRCSGFDIEAFAACDGACRGGDDSVDSATWFHTKDNGKEKDCDWVRDGADDDAMTVGGPGTPDITERCGARGQENAAACCEVCAALSPTPVPSTRPGIVEGQIEDDCASNSKRGRCQREFACGWSKKTGCSLQTSDDCYSGKARKKAKHCKKIDCCEWYGGVCGHNGACDSLTPDPTQSPTAFMPTSAPSVSMAPTGPIIAGTWTQLGERIDGEAAGDVMGFVAMSRDGNVIVLGAYANQEHGWQSGHARVYEWAETSGGYGSYGWAQRGPDIDAEMNNGIYGSCVDMNHDGSIITVGAQWNDGAAMLAGHVRVLRWNAATGDHDIMGQDIDSDGDTLAEQLGSSCALSGDGYTVGVGAKTHDAGNEYGDDRGIARVYTWDVPTQLWVQYGETIEGVASSDQAGTSVAISADGKTFAVGAAYHNNSRGHVRVFSWASGAWALKGEEIEGGNWGDYAHRCALNDEGTAIVVGSKGDDGPGQFHQDAGSVAVYDWVGTAWLQRGETLLGDNAYDYAGTVAMNAAGDVIAVGASRADSVNGESAGSVKVFQWRQGAWAQAGDEILGEEEEDIFGAYVALNGAGDRLLASSPWADGEDADDSGRGEARVFQLI